MGHDPGQNTGRIAVVASNLDDFNDGIPHYITERCSRTWTILRFAGSHLRTSSNEDPLRMHLRRTFHNAALHRAILMGGGSAGNDDEANGTLRLLRLVRMWHRTCRTLGCVPCVPGAPLPFAADPDFIAPDTVNPSYLAHPGLDMLWAIQTLGERPREQPGRDLVMQYKLLGERRNLGAKTGVWVWGGNDDATAHEVMLAVEGHPCAVVRGSGGFADALIAWLEKRPHDIAAAHMERLEWLRKSSGNFGKIRIVETAADTLRWLDEYGLVA